MRAGDTVDNVPGVTKVGPKTAVKWLTEFGSIDKLVEGADGIKGVAGSNLREAIPNFPLTRQLLTVKYDCDLTGHVESVDDLTPRERDEATLTELYERYGFRTWLRDLTGDAERVPTGDARIAAEVPAAPTELDYRIISDWAEFDAWFDKLQNASLVALDTETTSLDQMQAKLVGLSLAVEPGVACYIPPRCWRA
ncbi:hypothetical protein G6F65_020385 [Rhizopus arrhizus]|nr:hypothetical protein G6F65_020385 [Rhizopus arrhizus]